MMERINVCSDVLRQRPLAYKHAINKSYFLPHIPHRANLIFFNLIFSTNWHDVILACDGKQL
jgi:hypothetical protein